MDGYEYNYNFDDDYEGLRSKFLAYVQNGDLTNILDYIIDESGASDKMTSGLTTGPDNMETTRYKRNGKTFLKSAPKYEYEKYPVIVYSKKTIFYVPIVEIFENGKSGGELSLMYGPHLDRIIKDIRRIIDEIQ
jgi:hypothetical protein